MSRFAGLLAIAALAAFGRVTTAGTGAAGVENAQSGGATPGRQADVGPGSAEDSTQAPASPYRWHNGRWWYWTTNNRWLYWSDRQGWVAYQPPVARAPDGE